FSCVLHCYFMRHSELSFSTFFVSSMSELLKQVALDGCGIAWLPEYAIQQEIRSGKLVVLNRDELVIPIQAYAYRMNTRMNPVAERLWRTPAARQSHSRRGQPALK
ncbi:LysR substrate-binding domain-containing protein, partial [Escherichia sp. TWPC-MK]